VARIVAGAAFVGGLLLIVAGLLLHERPQAPHGGVAVGAPAADATTPVANPPGLPPVPRAQNVREAARNTRARQLIAQVRAAVLSGQDAAAAAAARELAAMGPEAMPWLDREIARSWNASVRSALERIRDQIVGGGGQ
jgi:hypothetical protein